jgi:hypothetical protein
MPVADRSGLDEDDLRRAAGVLVIRFDADLPGHEAFADDHPGGSFEARWRQWYALRADRLIRMLEAHAPGGLLDALLAGLLARKACVFRVPDDVLGRATGRWYNVEQRLPGLTDRPILVQLSDGREMISAGFEPGEVSPGVQIGWRLGAISGAMVARWYDAPAPPPVSGGVPAVCGYCGRPSSVQAQPPTTAETNGPRGRLWLALRLAAFDLVAAGADRSVVPAAAAVYADEAAVQARSGVAKI